MIHAEKIFSDLKVMIAVKQWMLRQVNIFTTWQSACFALLEKVHRKWW